MNEPHKFRSVALLVCRTFFRDRLKQLTDSPSHHAEAKTAASPWMMLAVAAAAALLIPAQTVSAAGACSDTAQAAFIACKNEVKDDEWIGRGNCYNVSDPDEQTDCLNDLAEETKEESGLCAEQRHTRLELCSDLTTPPRWRAMYLMIRISAPLSIPRISMEASIPTRFFRWSMATSASIGRTRPRKNSNSSSRSP